MRETLSQENQAFTQVLLLESRRLLQKFAPYALPNEPTIILAIPLRHGDNAIYNGPLRGNHYLFLNHHSNGLKDKTATKIKDRLTITHELAHQKHAEMMGPLLWWTRDVDSDISDDELMSQPIEKIFRKLWKLLEPDIAAITDALTEGFAYLTEILVYKQYYRSFKYSVSRREQQLEASALKEVGNGYHEIFYNTKKAEYDYYQKGFHLIKNLYGTFGLKGVLDFLKNVDYEKCNDITIQTSAFDEMMSDYRKIPLLASPRRGLVK